MDSNHDVPTAKESPESDSAKNANASENLHDKLTDNSKSNNSDRVSNEKLVPYSDKFAAPLAPDNQAPMQYQPYQAWPHENQGPTATPDAGTPKADDREVKPDASAIKSNASTMKSDATAIKPDGTVKSEGDGVKGDGSRENPYLFAPDHIAAPRPSDASGRSTVQEARDRAAGSVINPNSGAFQSIRLIAEVRDASHDKNASQNDSTQTGKETSPVTSSSEWSKAKDIKEAPARSGLSDARAEHTDLAQDSYRGPLNVQERLRQQLDSIRVEARKDGTSAALYLDTSRFVEKFYTRQDVPVGHGYVYVIDKDLLKFQGFSEVTVAQLDKTFRETGFAPEGEQRYEYYMNDGSILQRATPGEAAQAEQQIITRAQNEAKAQAVEMLMGLLAGLAGVKGGTDQVESVSGNKVENVSRPSYRVSEVAINKAETIDVMRELELKTGAQVDKFALSGGRDWKLVTIPAGTRLFAYGNAEKADMKWGGFQENDLPMALRENQLGLHWYTKEPPPPGIDVTPIFEYYSDISEPTIAGMSKVEPQAKIGAGPAPVPAKFQYYNPAGLGKMVRGRVVGWQKVAAQKAATP